MIELKTEKEYSVILNGMIEFIENLGLKVNTKTKARGHQGFFLKNRIDISSSLSNKRKIEVLIHEFTHYIHAKLDPLALKNQADLSVLFPKSDIKKIENELYQVTRFLEKNKAISKLDEQREETLKNIKYYDSLIKKEYPDFKRSYPCKSFEKEIKKTDAKYLLKYDRVQVKAMFLGKTSYYAVKNIDEDFPYLKSVYKNYIILKSHQRMLKRISGRINRLNKYYKKPTELFARFVEALFIDTAAVSDIAPHAYLVFCRELSENKYLELADFINNFF